LLSNAGVLVFSTATSSIDFFSALAFLGASAFSVSSGFSLAAFLVLGFTAFSDTSSSFFFTDFLVGSID
jgi:hypothetical protein